MLGDITDESCPKNAFGTIKVEYIKKNFKKNYFFYIKLKKARNK
jgi:hypothetical protein